MKKTVLIFTIVLNFMFFQNIFAQVITDSVDMGASVNGVSRPNDIFYSFKNGFVQSVERSSYDIAFYTNVFSSGIVLNTAKGNMLYTYPKGDTSVWNTTFDTTGLYSWEAMYNSEKIWEEGAFGMFQQGHPDYGWGRYNSISHNVVGDSLFIIKLGNSYKKLWILRKESMANTYYLRWANLDGSNQVDDTADCSTYTSKNFVGFNFSTGNMVDIEPASNSWDMKFTKYTAWYDNQMWYTLTGVHTNNDVSVQFINDHDTTYSFFDIGMFDTSSISTIGYSWWKLSGMSTLVKDSCVYFVKDTDGDVYKLVFASVSSPFRKIFFRKQFISGVGIETQISENIKNSYVYPNPASDKLTLILDLEKAGSMYYSVMDVSGKILYGESVNHIGSGLNQIQIPIENLSNGVYFMQIKDSGFQKTIKFVVNK